MGRLRTIIGRLRALINGTPKPDPWPEWLTAALKSEWLTEGVPPGTAPLYRVRYCPSFFDGCCISVVDGPDSAEVSLMAWGEDFRAWFSYWR